MLIHSIGSPNPYPEILSSMDILPTNTDSDASFQQIERWLDKCNTIHSTCWTDTPKQLPTRVLDVGQDGDAFVRLYETSGESERYICLSHCWGGYKSHVMTTSKTIAQNLRGIDMKSLPASFRDVAMIARRFGIRFLWIDSLCIIQDDRDDWEQEAARMASIYENAYLTVAGTHGNNSNVSLFSEVSDDISYRDGILQPHADRKLQIRNDKNELNTVYVRAYLPHSMEKDHAYDTLLQSQLPLLYRGWCFQERLLSPRVLHYRKNEVYWECQEESTCQCSPNGQVGTLKEQYRLAAASGSETKTDSSWHDIVEQYSTLDLSFPKDKLPALSGVASKVQSIQKTNYLAGLWEATFLYDLTWYPTPKNKIPLEWRAPTWSWVSIGGPIRYLDADDMVFTTKLLQAHCELKGKNPTGEVSEGFIRLSGPVREVSLEKQTNGTHLISGTKLDMIDSSFDANPDIQLRNQLSCLRLGQGIRGGPTWYYFIILEVVSPGSYEYPSYKRVGLWTPYTGGSDYDEEGFVAFLQTFTVQEVRVI